MDEVVTRIFLNKKNKSKKSMDQIAEAIILMIKKK